MDFEIATGVYVFESFRLDPVRRIVTRDRTKLEVTPRLFEILLYLVRHHQRVVSRDELQQQVWGRRTMDGSNLAVAISSLRKALQGDANGCDLIATVPGHGYRLVAEVTFEATNDHSANCQSETVSRATGTRVDRAGWWRNVALAAALAGAVVTSCVAIWYMALVAKRAAGPSAAVFAPPPHSVAVMAFANLSGDPAQEYFSDGISDELINALCQVGTLHVVARSSSFSFKGKAATIQTIARLLNVADIVEGSVRRDGTRLVIKATMFDGVSGGLIWSETYDRDENQILQTQEDLAQAVATGLQVTLRGIDAARLMAGGTANPRALDAYLRAMAAIDNDSHSEAAFKQDVALFEQAIALDPNFVMAKADLSIALWSYVVRGGSKDLAYLQQLRERAKNIAAEAVTLAPNSALAHLALGTTLGINLPDFARQEAEFARARALAPGNSRIVRQYARFALWAGHTAAGVQAAEQAAALSPASAREYYELAWNLYLARRPNDALAALQHAQELGRVPANLVKSTAGFIALLKGDVATAQAACADLDTFVGHECLAVAYHALGKAAEASAELAKMQQAAGDAGVFNYAEVNAQWGRTDDALHWLETAYRANDPALLGLRTSFFLDPIRQTSRYKAIESALHFPT